METIFIAQVKHVLTLSHKVIINLFLKNSNCGIATARAGNCIGGGDWTKFRILTDATEAFLENKNLNIRSPYSTRPWQHLLEPLYGYIILAEKYLVIKKKYSSHGILVQLDKQI